MRVLLTGATGFLGRRVLRALLDDGLTVRCPVRSAARLEIVRESAGEAADRVQGVVCDLASEADCRAVLRGCDVICHLAAARSGSTSSLVLNTVVPTRSLLNAAAGMSIERCVLVSSLGVYGPQQLPDGAVLDETCPVDAAPHLRDPYSYSKILQEEVARTTAAAHHIPLVTLRPGVIYGDERGLMSHRVGLPIGPCLLRLGGGNRIPLTHVENCAQAIALACTSYGAPQRVLNIVDDELPTGCDVIRAWRRAGHALHVLPVPACGVPWLARLNDLCANWFDGQFPRVLTPHRVAAMWKPLGYSNERARQVLGWQPEVSFEEACRRLGEPTRLCRSRETSSVDQRCSTQMSETVSSPLGLSQWKQ